MLTNNTQQSKQTVKLFSRRNNNHMNYISAFVSIDLSFDPVRFGGNA